MASVARIASEATDWNDRTAALLSRAVADYDLPHRPEWNRVGQVLGRFTFEGIEVYGRDAVQDQGTFVAPADIYLTLTYDQAPNEAVDFQESFPARVKFTLSETGEPTVTDIEIDTSAFFESA